tara:strand:- start:235 stop:588 length:354 start_codon:yes stop_codon:yes gene_type:complete
MKPASLGELVVRVEHALAKRALLMENRAYQSRLEQMVDELNSVLVHRKRGLLALNRLFQSPVGQSETARDAYTRLRESLATFSSELEGLATLAGVPIRSEATGRNPQDALAAALATD